VIKVHCEIFIKRDPDEVFEFISQVENNPLWQAGMTSCKVTTSGPISAGSHYEQEANFLGREVKSVFEITEFEDGRLITGKSIRGSFPISFTRIVTPVEKGAQVETYIQGDPKGFYKIAQPLMKWMVKHAIEKDYKALKILLENK
jgi:uncharacterized membrane protein